MCPIFSKLHRHFPKSKILQYAVSKTECEPKNDLTVFIEYARENSLLLKVQNPFEIWKLTKLIGIGAFGKIFRVENIYDGIEAAMKVINTDEYFDLDNLIDEIEIMIKCRHKNICNFYDSFVYDSKIYIIMEFCEFGSLDSIMCKLNRNFNENEIRFIVRQVLEALVFLHETAFVIHRDIKAANILLTKNGKIKLTDFGVSANNWYLGQNKTKLAGSPYWISPEMLSCKKEMFRTYNNKVDIWSLGITCIELAEKVPPNNLLKPKDVMKKIYWDCNSPGFQEPDTWSIEFQDFVSQCLIKNPKKRLNASELLEHSFIIKEKAKHSNFIRNNKIFDLFNSSCLTNNFNKTNNNDSSDTQGNGKLLEC
ncbi:serine threonine- kinase 10-like [Brachionus plicatilis]|uniref:non-specific serine/threonine protein kinase n=1 Tax=Brachionus plicatilis TaxID=10195 RepID=A0A3M7QG73_BRAPC|nr:serine threonine- kinase 10-like [Brachionus plicatilis]